MARQVANVDIQIDTFGSWIARTNELLEAFSNEVLTANSTSGVTGTPTSNRNSTLYGRFNTNTFYSSASFQVGDGIFANTTSFTFGPNIKIVANNRIGTTGQILAIGTTGLYWTDAGLGTVTRVQAGNGLLGDVTTAGTLSVKAGNGITVGAAGVAIDPAYIATLPSANASTLLSRTWASPARIGSSVANTGTFTSVTADSYSITGDPVFTLSSSLFRTTGSIDATTPNVGSTGGVRVRGNPTSGFAYIQVTDSLGSTEWGHFKAHSNGYIVWSGAIAGANYPNLIPSGTVMLFGQTNAPTGWTKLTTHNDKALRVVSGAASSGGATTFSAAFNSSFTSDGTTLTENQIPSHRHGMFDQYDTQPSARELGDFPSYSAAWGSNSGGNTEYSMNTNLTQDANFGVSGAIGGSEAHTHTMNFNLAYVDVILASKN
jgi:hypothetical protein